MKNAGTIMLLCHDKYPSDITQVKKLLRSQLKGLATLINTAHILRKAHISHS